MEKQYAHNLSWYFGRNYDREIKAFWDKCFAELPNKAKIVDLATGNGALAMLAMGHSKKHNRIFK